MRGKVMNRLMFHVPNFIAVAAIAICTWFALIVSVPAVAADEPVLKLGEKRLPLGEYVEIKKLVLCHA